MPEKKVLTKADIAAVSDIRVEEIEVPEWGGVVCMRELNGAGRDTFEKEVSSRTGKGSALDITGLRAVLLSLVLCTPEGELLYSSEDVEELNKKSATVTSRLFEHAQTMNNIGEEALEQAEKN